MHINTIITSHYCKVNHYIISVSTCLINKESVECYLVLNYILLHFFLKVAFKVIKTVF